MYHNWTVAERITKNHKGPVSINGRGEQGQKWVGVENILRSKE